MNKNFDDFYNETYANFYNTCIYKDLISKSPIPYKTDTSLKVIGQYENETIIIKNTSIDTQEEKHELFYTIYHELTHYYDEMIFKYLGYSDDDIKSLMLTYSEIHAAYNGMLAFFNFKTLSVKKRIDLKRMKFNNHTMAEHITFQITKYAKEMNNMLGFKCAMYFFGREKSITKNIKRYSFDKFCI